MSLNTDAPDDALAMFGPHSRGLRELFARAQGDPGALGALMAMAEALRLATADRVQAGPRRSRRTRLQVVEAVSGRARDASAEDHLSAMATDDPDQRSLAAEQWRALYLQEERIALRAERLRRYARVHLAGGTVNAAAYQIKRDIDRRSGSNIRSTGSPAKDQLIDAIIVTTPHIATKTIRNDLCGVYNLAKLP